MIPCVRHKNHSFNWSIKNNKNQWKSQNSGHVEKYQKDTTAVELPNNCLTSTQSLHQKLLDIQPIATWQVTTAWALPDPTTNNGLAKESLKRNYRQTVCWCRCKWSINPNWAVLHLLKSVHFKKTVAQISFLSKLWYFLFWLLLKVPQLWKKRNSRNCLL